MPNDTNRWSLFIEENKKKENGPDFTGEADINGVKYRLAGWRRVSQKTGKKFLSGEIESAKQNKAPDFDDDFQI
jgi:hypothetical protein